MRAWLDDYKPFSASEYAEHQPFMHDLAPADWLDTPSALELSTTSEAAAAEVVTYAAASESPAALSDDTAGGGRTALAASNRASSSKSTHFTHELLSLGWRFSIGVHDSVQLPCGSMWVATRSRETVRSVHGLQPLASAKLVHVSIPLAVLMLVLATSVFAVTLCITLEHKSTMEAWMNDLPYKIAAVIFQTLYLLSASLLFTSRLGAEVTAIRGGRVPKPLMQSAKLEYALLMAIFGASSNYVLVSSARYLGPLLSTSVPAAFQGTHTYLNVLFLRLRIAASAVFVALATFETGLTLAHTLAAAIRHRDVRYLLSCTTDGTEGAVPIL